MSACTRLADFWRITSRKRFARHSKPLPNLRSAPISIALCLDENEPRLCFLFKRDQKIDVLLIGKNQAFVGDSDFRISVIRKPKRHLKPVEMIVHRDECSCRYAESEAIA